MAGNDIWKVEVTDTLLKKRREGEGEAEESNQSALRKTLTNREKTRIVNGKNPV